MSYSYIVNSQKPTAVNYTAVCNFTSPLDTNLIIAKGNHLEIQTLKEDGLAPILDVALFGKITALDFYRPANCSQDVIFVLVEKKHFSVIGYDTEKKALVTRATGNLKDRVGRESGHGYRGFIDPDNRMIAMFLYDGLLKIIPIEAAGAGGLKEAFNLRLDMLRFIDVKFLHGCPRPTLCMLHEDNRGNRHIKTFVVDMRDKELISGPWTQNNVEHGASLLIPVPSPTNGVILVGQTTITYLSGTGNVQSVAIQQTQIRTYGSINSDGTRYLLGDHRGTLYVLVLQMEAGVVISIVLDLVGTTSIAETLSYLDNGVVFVGSVYGDSQLIKLTSSPDEDGSSVEVLETYMNIGPVMDMCVVASERQGQCQVVTCSGAYNDGSLRVVRSGIGIHEQASIEMPGIKGLWSIRPKGGDMFHKYLIQSYIGETRILSIDEEEMSETEISGFSSSQQSLYCGNVCGDLMVQVVSTGVRLVRCDTLDMVYEFSASRTITVAVGNDEQIVLALTGGEMLYLEVDPQGMKLIQVASATLDQDIACMSLRSLSSNEMDSKSSSGDDNMKVEEDEQGKNMILAVGMWTDNSVRLFVPQTLQELTRVQLGVETQAQARDVILVSLGDLNTAILYLMVGLGDGTLITFVVDFHSGLPNVTTRRKVVLGMHPISLTCFTNAGVPCVFAACDRPTVVSTRNGKLIFSVVNIPEVTGMAPFHSEQFPECLALSSEAGLMIGIVDEIQKLHVQTFPLGEAPRRIAHCSQSGVYAVTSERTTVTDRGEETSNRVLFFDDGGSMEKLFQYELDVMEQGISSTVCVFEGSQQEYIVIGTAVVIPEEQEASQGRILVFEILGEKEGEDRRLNLIIEKDAKGAVYSLAAMNGKLAAGVGSKVQIYRVTNEKDDRIRNSSSSSSGAMDLGSSSQTKQFSTSEEPISLQYECGHHGHILALYLKARGDYVLVGDLYRSMTLLQYKAGEETGTLEEAARDFNSNYMRAVEILGDDDHFLGADDNGNIFSVRRQTDAATDEERSKMEPQGGFHLGDSINVFRRGSLNSQPSEQDATSTFTASSSSSSSSSSSNNKASATSSSPVKSTLSGLAAVAGIGATSILFGTISGAIGTIITLNLENYTFFSALERAMKAVLPAEGGLSHDDWRCFYNEHRSYPQRNMVDGDLVEQFLDLDRGQLEQIVRQINDDLAMINANDVSTASSGSGTSASLHVLLSGEKVITMLTVEDCTRRVEDIARLH